MVKHKARAGTVVAPEWVGSLSAKGPMKPPSRASSTPSQTPPKVKATPRICDSTQQSQFEWTLKDPTLGRNHGRGTPPSGLAIESAQRRGLGRDGSSRRRGPSCRALQGLGADLASIAGRREARSDCLHIHLMAQRLGPSAHLGEFI